MEVDTIFDRLRAYQWLLRVVQPSLSTNQYTLMSYLLDQSVGYGRDWLRASEQQMLKGTEWDLPKLNMSRAVYYRTRKDLVDLGLIEIERDVVGRGGVCTYTINLEWESEVALPEPKRKKGIRTDSKGSQYEIKGSHIETEGSQIETPKIYSKKDSKRQQVSAGAEEIIDQVKSTPRSPKKRADGSTDTKWLWREGWLLGGFDSVPPQLSAKNVAILRRAWGTAPKKDVDVFAMWMLEDWHRIMATTFNWIASPPKQPEAEFISRFIEKFFTAFSEHRFQTEGKNKLTTHEELYHRHRREGLSHAEALAKIAKSAPKEKDEKTERLEGIVAYNKAMEEAERQRRAKVAETRPDAPKSNLSPGTLDGEELDVALDKIASTKLPDWEEDV